jgi:transketolase
MASLNTAPGAGTRGTDDAEEALQHQRMANALRALAMDAVEKAQSGHPGLPMGAADIVTVLFTKFLKFDPTHPDWPDRDRFVFSPGHGSMLIYGLLHLLGYDQMTIEEIRNFRQMGSRTPGHPEYGHTQGVETTTGPLGQGLANAVGMALAEEILAARFGRDIVEHNTYALVSDGDLMEGISQEAISIAGHLKLRRLVVIFDDNEITIDGPTALSESGDVVRRFEAAGWEAVRIDGHDRLAIEQAIRAARESDRPTLIAARTTIGFGAPTKAGTAASHGAPLGAKEIDGAREALDWPYEPFDIPADVRDAWRLAGLRHARERRAWERRVEALEPELRGEFERRMRGDLPAGFARAIEAAKAEFLEGGKAMATRKASEMVLEHVNQAVPETLGGSADLTGSNNTRTKGQERVSPGRFSGRYVHWGVREHAMASAMNGMALHGGLLPYGGTFLVFSDYCRPAIRLAALMGLRVVYVFTHDSIGLGEDGPTHQPVEHLASLRAMPNLAVLRPADGVETAECWELALTRQGPSVLALTRQNIGPVRETENAKNRCARGAYELAGAEGEAEVSLFASGSEVDIALAARSLLAEDGIAARVVSVPSFAHFEAQPQAYRDEIVGTAPVRIAIEAGVRQGWDRFIGSDGAFVGMTGFGASGPYQELYAHFGITAEEAAARAREMIAARRGPDAEDQD